MVRRSAAGSKGARIKSVAAGVPKSRRKPEDRDGDRLKKNPWASIGLSAWSLGAEATSVVALRLLKIAFGGAAGNAEARLMVDEKIKAGLDLQRMFLTGAIGLTPHRAAIKTLAHYRRKVRANRRRLAKG